VKADVPSTVNALGVVHCGWHICFHPPHTDDCGYWKPRLVTDTGEWIRAGVCSCGIVPDPDRGKAWLERHRKRNPIDNERNTDD